MSTDTTHDSPSPTSLPRVLGTWSAASILIGSIIGSGIFAKPTAVAQALPSPGWTLFCWLAAGALALIGSLIFAELGSAYPRAGGQYTFLREAFGNVPAFLFGWTNLVIINAASIAALAVISAEFSFNVLPASLQPGPDSHWHRTLPVLMIAALTLANRRGLRWGASIQNTFTVLKLGALGLIIAGLFFPGKSDWSRLTPFWEIQNDGNGEALWLGFKGAFLAIFWAYDGWYLLSFSGGEIRDPQRNIPRGFIIGIVVVISVYLAFNLAVLTILPLAEIAAVDSPGGVAGQVARHLYGDVGLVLISLGIVGSTFGAANANLLTGPRLSYAMAQDRLFFPRFGKLHPSFLTPGFAIIAQGVVGAAYVYAGTFDQLTDSVVFAAWIFYLLTVVGYFRLRRRNQGRDGVFRAPGHPFPAAFFVLFASIFVAYSFWDSFSLTLEYFSGSGDGEPTPDGLYLPLVLAIILAGLPLYAFVRRRA
jgi:APA family basic amino acid/polyamine antiporter